MKASLLLSIIFGVITVNLIAGEIGDAPKVFDAKEMPLMTEPKIKASERKSTKCPFNYPYVYQNGEKCCKSYQDENGHELTIDSTSCNKDEFVACPGGGICTNPDCFHNWECSGRKKNCVEGICTDPTELTCEDTYEHDCSEYLSFCDNTEFAWFAEVCKKSCGKCGCFNIGGDHACQSIIDYVGDCTFKPTYMEKNCQKACGYCEGGK